MFRLYQIVILIFFCLPLPAQEANRYDIVIHEIFADPSPSRGMPPWEFIELRNRTNKELNLRNWTISSSTSTGRISTNFLLKPDSMVILCGSSALAAYQLLGSSVAVSGFPALDNNGDTIQLRSPGGQVIHAISWNKKWYRNELKEEGGWSLEMRDDGRPCLGASNWMASNHDRGATPGKTNSVRSPLPDSQLPELMYAYFKDSVTLHLVFNEPIAETPVGEILLDNTALSRQQLLPPLFNVLESLTIKPIKTDERAALLVRGYSDCTGNQILETRMEAGPFSEPVKGSLVINEVLFNPPIGGFDYVELFNKTNRNFDVSQLYLANRGTDGRIASITRLRSHSYPLLPGEYLLICVDTSWVRGHYPLSTIARAVSPASLPSFPDDAGEVILLNRQGYILDELRYHEKWHGDLISNRSGISLERISANGPTAESANWHSASTSSGYGTPGQQNSQWRPDDAANTVFSLSGRLISPNLDARDDFLLVHYRFPRPGYLVTLRAFDQYGRWVATLVSNALAGTSGSFRWAGSGPDNVPLPAGNYILLAEYFHGEGQSGQQKWTVGILR